MRHRLARLLVIGTLMVTPVAAAGCGAAAHYIGGQIAHHVANHVIGVKRANRVFCIYNVYRTVHDFTHHHLLFGALNAHAAFVNCERGFAKNAR
ncbi:MAG TPA: hypothetical protein VG223_12160 [Solirubrobacteraceae bacterium]|jgi:hypothetical protein|nr:hypothetical protein [Solirubrobacteraceae bacterium]